MDINKEYTGLLEAFNSVYETKETVEVLKESRETVWNENVDLFDYLLEYLVAEGHAETNKEALAIMATMSVEDIRGIVEATYGGEKPTDIPADKRMVVTNADKAGNTRAYQELMKKNPNYVAAPHLKGV